MIAPRLREHRASTLYATAGGQPLSRPIELDGAHAFAQLGDHLGCRSKLGWEGERLLAGIGHRAIGTEEVKRARRM